MTNLAAENLSEEDKIKAVLYQSSYSTMRWGFFCLSWLLFGYYGCLLISFLTFFFLVVFPRSYSTKSTTSLPANYTCYRCGNAGHHIRNCPTSVRGKKNQRFPPPSAFPLAPWWPNVFDVPCLTAGQERRACPQVEEEHRHPALLHGGGGRPQHQRRHADQLRELRHPCHTRVRRIRSNSLNQCLKIWLKSHLFSPPPIFSISFF